ncbi:MAG: helix-turn-helix domain-containing protein [Actinomycetota bacterium]
MANHEQHLDSIRDRYPPILTTAQVAELLGLNVRTVMVMANDGRLPASRLPGSRKYHFLLEDVLATLTQHRIQPEPVKTATATKASATKKGASAGRAGATKSAKASPAAVKRRGR